VPEHVAELGGNALMTRVGHSFIKAKMRETKAVFAGELSGHYYYSTNSNADSGDITLVLMLGLLSTGKKLSELVKPLCKYAQSGEINFEVEDKSGVIDRLREEYRDGRQSELDGITVEYDDWWFNVRPSNTEPLLRLNVEAKNKASLAKKIKELTSCIKE